MTSKQIENLIKKHSTTGAEHPSAPCRFCGQPITPDTLDIDLVVTKRKTLVIFHRACYRKEFYK